MDLNEVVVFIKVVQAGSFTKAGQTMGMPLSTVSEKVSSLEARLGVTLLHRTTRKLSVTPVGQAFFNRCLQGLEEFKAAESEVFASHKEPSGTFRITAPVEIGSAILPRLLSEFTSKFPKVTVDAILTNRVVNFLSEEVDVAIRAGALNDSTLIAKKVGEFYFAPFASPQYLKRHPALEKPKDLQKHSVLHFTHLDGQKWILQNSKEEVSVSPRIKMSVDDTATLIEMTVLGDGISLLPNFSAYPYVQRGDLVRLLPGWMAVRTPVHIVYPSQRFVSANLSEFMKVASEHLKSRFNLFTI